MCVLLHKNVTQVTNYSIFSPNLNIILFLYVMALLFSACSPASTRMKPCLLVLKPLFKPFITKELPTPLMLLSDAPRGITVG